MAAAGNKASPTEKFWFKTLESWKSKSTDDRRRMRKTARSYRGRHWGGDTHGPDTDDSTKVETNYFYAFADTLIAQVVPLNPAVTILANREELKDSALYREALVNTVFTKERMAEKLWAACTRASVWPRAWMKAVWSETRKRPIFRVINPQYIWFDVTAEAYEDIRYIIEVTPLSRADFNKRLRGKNKKGFYRADAADDKNICFGKWPKWLEPDADWDGEPEDDSNKELQIVRDNYEWTVVYEVYDLRAKKFYHFADGSERPLMVADLPYRYLSNPYMLLTFNDNLEDLGGMSDADLVYPLVERKNEMDSLELWHTKTAIPATVIHEGLVDDPDAFIDAFEAIDGPGQAISLNAKAGVGISQVLGQTPVSQLPIEWGRVEERLDSNIQFVLGLPSYSRGELGQSDVATELALTDTATRTRNARRQKVVYNAIEWCASATIALYQEFMPEDETLAVRLLDEGGKEKELNRELLEFGDKADDPWAYEYTSHPYSAEEANSIVQLKQIEAFIPIFLQGAQAGVVDLVAVFTKLAELLKMPELVKKEQPAAPQMPMPPQGGAPGGGGMPTGQGMPPEMMGPAMGGQVLSGTGAQAVPGGMEGGMQPGAGGPGAPPMAGV
jgi:hypothetical protein